MNKNVTIGIVVLVLIAGGIFIYNNSKSSDLSGSPQDNTGAIVTPTTPVTPTPASATPNIVEFTVSGKNFAFDPSTLSVKKGDTVRITFKDTQGMHNWKIDEFNVTSKTIQGGSEDVVEFVADKVGSFEYYCAVGTHRAMGMKGTLVVTE